MLSPFPGMNPYLENPELWREFHNRLIVAIADAIEPNLSRQYRVAIEKRTYLSDGEDSGLAIIPDVSVFSPRAATSSSSGSSSSGSSSTATLPELEASVRVAIPLPEEVEESYLEIREGGTGYVVTVLEVLSPKNKSAGVGREKYKNKRIKVLSSPTHLVEIDLLRGGKPMPILGEIPPRDYSVLVSRSGHRPRADLYPFSVRVPIPCFSLPLQAGDTEPIVDLQNLSSGIYERARFDMAIDYTREPIPSLKPEDRDWADALLRSQGLR